MRLDSVEIKVTLSSDQVTPAIEAFGLESGGREWEIYFCEDVARGVTGGTPMLDAGLVLRARDKGGNKGDATIKLRPGRRSQLTPQWLGRYEGDDWELKVEADWAGDRRVLAAALTADCTGDRIAAVLSGQLPVSHLFNDEQHRFLADGAPLRVNLDVLTLLGPVAAVRWPQLRVEPKLEARAERWTVGELDFLELSVVADLDEALAQQAALAEFVTGLGFTADHGGQAKTRRVVDHLVASATRF